MKTLSIAVLLAASISLFATASIASADPNLGKRPSFDHEKCANKCQEKFDKSLTVCHRKDYEPDDKYAFGRCAVKADESNVKCLSKCPVDVGRSRLTRQ